MSTDPKIKTCSRVMNCVYFTCLFAFYLFINHILQIFRMDMQFLYEDGQGHVVDENEVEPIDLVIDEELFVI